MSAVLLYSVIHLLKWHHLAKDKCIGFEVHLSSDLYYRETRFLVLFAEGNPRLIGMLQRHDAIHTLLLQHNKICITRVPTMGCFFGCKYQLNGEEGRGVWH